MKKRKTDGDDCIIKLKDFVDGFIVKKEFNCICGNRNVHTKECLRKKQDQRRNKWRRNQRRKLRLDHRCIICKKKVKPIIVYHQYCKNHKPKK